MKIYKANKSGYLFTNFKVGTERKPITINGIDDLKERLLTLQALSDIIQPKDSKHNERKRDIVFIPDTAMKLFTDCCVSKNCINISTLESCVIDLDNVNEDTSESDISKFEQFDYFIYDTKVSKNFFDIYPIIQLVNTTNVDTGIIKSLQNNSKQLRNMIALSLIDYIYNPNLTHLKINDEYNYLQFLIPDFVIIKDSDGRLCCEL